jgi:hypothetical protein
MVLVGVIIGMLYGLESLSIISVDLVVLGGLAGFVPWVVLKLDLRGFSELSQESYNQTHK